MITQRSDRVAKGGWMVKPTVGLEKVKHQRDVKPLCKHLMEGDNILMVQLLREATAEHHHPIRSHPSCQNGKTCLMKVMGEKKEAGEQSFGGRERGRGGNLR